jgi:hypothetical protein
MPKRKTDQYHAAVDDAVQGAVKGLDGMLDSMGLPNSKKRSRAGGSGTAGPNTDARGNPAPGYYIGADGKAHRVTGAKSLAADAQRRQVAPPEQQYQGPASEVDFSNVEDSVSDAGDQFGGLPVRDKGDGTFLTPGGGDAATMYHWVQEAQQAGYANAMDLWTLAPDNSISGYNQWKIKGGQATGADRQNRMPAEVGAPQVGAPDGSERANLFAGVIGSQPGQTFQPPAPNTYGLPNLDFQGFNPWQTPGYGASYAQGSPWGAHQERFLGGRIGQLMQQPIFAQSMQQVPFGQNQMKPGDLTGLIQRPNIMGQQPAGDSGSNPGAADPGRNPAGPDYGTGMPGSTMGYQGYQSKLAPPPLSQQTSNFLYQGQNRQPPWAQQQPMSPQPLPNPSQSPQNQQQPMPNYGNLKQLGGGGAGEGEKTQTPQTGTAMVPYSGGPGQGNMINDAADPYGYAGRGGGAGAAGDFAMGTGVTEQQLIQDYLAMLEETFQIDPATSQAIFEAATQGFVNMVNTANSILGQIYQGDQNFEYQMNALNQQAQQFSQAIGLDTSQAYWGALGQSYQAETQRMLGLGQLQMMATQLGLDATIESAIADQDYDLAGQQIMTQVEQILSQERMGTLQIDSNTRVALGELYNQANQISSQERQAMAQLGVQGSLGTGDLAQQERNNRLQYSLGVMNSPWGMAAMSASQRNIPGTFQNSLLGFGEQGEQFNPFDFESLYGGIPGIQAPGATPDILQQSANIVPQGQVPSPYEVPGAPAAPAGQQQPALPGPAPATSDPGVSPSQPNVQPDPNDPGVLPGGEMSFSAQPGAPAASTNVFNMGSTGPGSLAPYSGPGFMPMINPYQMSHAMPSELNWLQQSLGPMAPDYFNEAEKIRTTGTGPQSAQVLF